jgi:bifunctional DNA-binding transcriptional regulator/antitoxin component of YhaV-PrlF toxin-antitoxin module
MTNSTIQVRKKGGLTLPVDIRQKYGVDEGDIFTLIDMGDGSFFLTPRVSNVARLGSQIDKILKDSPVDLDDLLTSLDEEREQYYREHYAHD